MKKWLAVFWLFYSACAWPIGRAPVDFSEADRQEDGPPPGAHVYTSTEYEFGGWRGELPQRTPQRAQTPNQFRDIPQGPRLTPEDEAFINRPPSYTEVPGGQYRGRPEGPETQDFGVGSMPPNQFFLNLATPSRREPGRWPNPNYTPGVNVAGVFSGDPEQDFRDYANLRQNVMPFDHWYGLDRLAQGALQDNRFSDLREMLPQIEQAQIDFLRRAKQLRDHAQTRLNQDCIEWGRRYNQRWEDRADCRMHQDTMRVYNGIINRVEGRTRLFAQKVDERQRIRDEGAPCGPETPPELESRNTQFGQNLYKIARKLYGFCPVDLQKRELRELGKIAVSIADYEFVGNHKEEASVYRHIAETVLDMVVGIDPVTGFIRSSYEMVVGKNLVTGEPLTKAERAFAALGVISAGNWSAVKKMGDGIRHITNARRMRHLQDAEHAYEHARHVYNSASDLVYRHPMNPGALHDLELRGIEDISHTFRSASYYTYVTNQATTLYRVTHSGIANNIAHQGHFWSRTRPEGASRAIIELALERRWGREGLAWNGVAHGNNALKVVEITAPKGTILHEGIAASIQRLNHTAGDYHLGNLVGGGNQVVLKDLPLEAWPKTIWSLE